MNFRNLFFSLVLVLACAIAPAVYSAPIAIIDPSVELANPVIIAQGNIRIGGTAYAAFHVTGRNEAHYLIVLDDDGGPLLVYAVLDPTKELKGDNLAIVWTAFDAGKAV